MTDTLVLSRYFHDDLKFVSSPSTTCEDNFDWVGQHSQQEKFFGFNNEEKLTSEEHFQHFKEFYEKNIKCKNFRGFSKADIVDSKKNHEKLVEAYQVVSYKITTTTTTINASVYQSAHIHNKIENKIKEKRQYKKKETKNTEKAHKFLESSSKYFQKLEKSLYSDCKRKVRQKKNNKIKITNTFDEGSVLEKPETGLQSDYFKNTYTTNNLIKTEDNNTEDIKDDCIDINHEIKNKLKFDHSYSNETSCSNELNIAKVEQTHDEIKIENVKEEIQIHDFVKSHYELQYFSELTDKKLDNNRVYWIPPRSPHNLIEEVLYHDPWALLVATIFLNRTTCMLARPHIFWFLVENPDPHYVMDKYPKDLEKYFVSLGLIKTRAVQVWRMSCEYLNKKWNNPSELYGIGDYGNCAYKMFCLGDFSVQPKDRFLKIYKAWYEKIVRKRIC